MAILQNQLNNNRPAVSNLNTALIEVRTDDGDLVEAHGGYALRAITYDKDKQTYTVACTTAADDTTAQAISQLVSRWRSWKPATPRSLHRWTTSA